MARERNVALAALLREAGWSQPQAAAAAARVAAECGVRELEAISRSHISMWVLGTKPSGRAPHILREALSRKLGRRLTLADLGHPRRALALADAAMSRDCYGQASHREKALLAIVHARALAADGDRAGTLAAISRAERDLARADTNEAPARIGFFQEASLAHETACALRDIGQPLDAEIHFKRSVDTRRRQQFARTRSVTLGHLGAVQVKRGNLDEACATWNEALDAMAGIQSGRPRDVIVRIQSDLSPVR
ncbi:hypothetical protein [Streptomyces sp. Root369]|uniref:hypothetical protein n=1 Tax=Streptomyces sp. Root369 TaxID=1736523 RepID=UPI000ADC139C|nr:hypothetical protein [Streptomyces sp. Root369]